MTSVITQPAGGPARQHYSDTIESPVDLRLHRAALGPDLFARLNKIYPSGSAPMWGVTPGRGGNAKKFHRVSGGDSVVFGRDSVIFAVGTITATFHNPGLAERLWGRDEQGQTWEYMYAVDQIRDVEIPYREFAMAVGYKPNWPLQGFNVLDEAKSAAALSVFGWSSDQHPSPITKGEFERAVRDFDGDVDAEATAQRRKEQGYIRAVLFPEALSRCDMCGDIFPREFLIAAHIKKRAKSTYEEKIDIPNNVMAACAFGCDGLYERGYITVDETGTVRAATRLLPEGTLPRQRAAALQGRSFGGPSLARREQYFTWHRTYVFLNPAHQDQV